MAKKHSQNSKKATSGTGRKKVKVAGIIVLFRSDNIGVIAHSVKMEQAVYDDDVSMTHTKAMAKILTALAKGETKVVI